jgi:nucleotide-binding universal stress UspA family protein
MSDEALHDEPGPGVVVGIDDSAPARAAVDFAVDEARQRAVPLILVHGFTWPWIYPPLTAEHDLTDPGPRARAGQLLAETAARLRADHPHLTVRTRLHDGYAAQVLVDHSQDAALVVVGHRGAGGFAGLLAGSVAIHTATHAHCPVVVVRGDRAKPDAPVLVGIDGSPDARDAAEFAFAVAARRGAPVVALTVWPATPLWRSTIEPGDPRDTAADVQWEAIRGCVAGYPDVRVRTEIMHRRSPAAGLLTAASEAALVVVGSRGIGGLRGLLLGSVGRALIEHAPCPVVVVRRTE